MDKLLSLFTKIITLLYLTNMSTILFFSKEDIFRKKIQSTSLQVCFLEYLEKNKYKKTQDYIINKFLAYTTNKISHLLTDILYM